MCFYDQIQFSCGDYKWGHFRQHCTKEYRTGETCGMKLVMENCPTSEKCKLCQKMDLKLLRIEKERETLRRWKTESVRGWSRSASIAGSEQKILQLQNEYYAVEMERSARSQSLDGGRWGGGWGSEFAGGGGGVAVATAAAPSMSFGGRTMMDYRAAPLSSYLPTVKKTDTLTSAQTKTAPTVKRKVIADDDTDDDEMSRTVLNRVKYPLASKNQLIIPKTRSNLSKEPLHDTALSIDKNPTKTQPETISIPSIPSIPVCSRETYSRWEKEVAVTWTCSCGTSFSEIVVEFKPGAAQLLAAGTSCGSPVDIEKLAGSEDITSSTTSSTSFSDSDGPTSPTKRSSPQKSSNINLDSKQNFSGPAKDSSPARREYILMCKSHGTDVTLKHADITKAPCDYSSFHVLNSEYFGRWHKFFHWFYLKEISSVEFVRFFLYWKQNVSVEEKDIGSLPPSSSEDYSHMPNTDTNPPVLRTAMRHFIQHPDHAPKVPCHRPAIPKKLREELALSRDNRHCEGYGILILERVYWVKVFVIEAIFATLCVIFAAIWCIKNNGGIQDGFAIAGTGIAYATIMLGAFQAAYQRS